MQDAFYVFLTSQFPMEVEMMWQHIQLASDTEFAASASSASTRSVASYFRPEVSINVLEAETRWAMFTAKHNLAYFV